MTLNWLISNMHLFMRHRNRLAERKIIIYGANPAGYLAAALLKDLDLEVAEYIDDHPRRQGQTFGDGIIRVPARLGREIPGQVAIVLCGVYYDHTKKRLNDLGFTENEDFFSADLIGYPPEFATIAYLDFPDWLWHTAEHAAAIDHGYLEWLFTIFESIDFYRFENIRTRYQQASLAETARPVTVPHGIWRFFPSEGYNRFVNLEHFLDVEAVKACMLGLHRSHPMRILDIGTGCGYFPYVCNRLGHEALGFDMEGVAVFDAVVDFLNIKRITGVVETFKPLPDLGNPFDLITAYHAAFYNDWQATEWDFFLKDLAGRLLNKNGQALFVMPKIPDRPLAAYFLANGARLSRFSLYFPSFDKFR